MSQAMKQKSLKTTQTAEEPSELSFAEQWVEKLTPHASQIALGIAVAFLAFIGIVYLINSSISKKESQWRQLNFSVTEVGISGNTSSLKQVAEQFPEGRAGKWALQLAGDYDLRSGLRQLSYDREGGLKLIEKARDTLQELYDAPASQKTTMLQRRSTYALAYAQESLGNFDQAKKLYQELVDAAPDSAFAEPAKRGLARASDQTYAELFTKFTDYDDPLSGDAPGPAVPSKPDISFPDIDAPSNELSGGGDFGTEPEDPQATGEEGSDSAESGENASENSGADKND
jgi:tetratricopeptide (TPR) repeat protein